MPPIVGLASKLKWKIEILSKLLWASNDQRRRNKKRANSESPIYSVTVGFIITKAP